MARYAVQHRRGTLAQWIDKGFIPLAGELVVEIDEVNNLHKLKIGDGATPYADLAYLQVGNEEVTQLLAKAIPRVVTVTLDVTKWGEITCASNPNLGYYNQTIVLDNITPQSRLDLQPNADMLAEFQNLSLAFVTENNNGVISVCSVGDKPTKSYTMQATIVETEIDTELDKVVGITVGTPTTVPTKTSELINDIGFITSQDINEKANKSDAETWVFVLSDGTEITKRVVLA